MSTGYDLQRNAYGRLVLTLADGSVHVAVVPVRAFPVAAPDQGVALLNSAGREVLWMECLSAVPQTVRSLIEEDLRERDFMPEIQRILSVSSVATPSSWQVQTDRGLAALHLKAEEDIRRLGADGLLITDRHGVQFLVRKLQQLDRHSRRLLDHFL